MPVRRIHYGCIPMGNDLVFFITAIVPGTLPVVLAVIGLLMH
jgi:hypothetical protein